MDIKHLRYFTSIVENDFNLSQSAEILYVSQPALSIMINDFEKEKKVKLFKRDRGRITGLTYSGEKYYYDAKEVLHKYHEMQQNLHSKKDQMEGSITIGIPPLVLSVVFSTIMPKLILENPKIQFNIKEIGAYNLKNELLLENVDIAVLLHPEGISKNRIESYEIQRSELAVFLSPNHHLAKNSLIHWRQLEREKMAIFDETFMIHHLIKGAFERNNIQPNIILTSGSWDFLINSTKINQELFSILPVPISEHYQFSDISSIPMKDPIPWRVTICRLKKEAYSNLEAYILDSLLQEFENN